jgi:hypothetical protein
VEPVGCCSRFRRFSGPSKFRTRSFEQKLRPYQKTCRPNCCGDIDMSETIPFSEIFEKWLQNSGFVREYDALEEEFALATALKRLALRQG